MRQGAHLQDEAMNHITETPTHNPTKRVGLLPIALLLSLALIAAACSSSSSASDTASTEPPAANTETTAPPSAAEVEPPTSTPATTSPELEAYFDQLKASGFSGVVAVREGPDITSRAIGVADRENDVQVDAETVFDVGSLTKQFTAAAILRLEMDGRLSVNDTLGEHVPGLPDDKAALTLHQLLTHTAGLPVGLGADDEAIGRSDYIALVSETPLLSEPGERYAYSNVGYSLLAIVIERETGQLYEGYLRSALFEPAGMEDTGYVLPEWEGHNIAVGYDKETGDRFGRPDEQGWGEDGPYWHLLGNGGILSTAGDMLRWDQALTGDLVLDEAAKEKLFAAHVRMDPSGEAYYGYGWQIIPLPTGKPLIKHDGGNHIFYADFLRLVDEDVTVFMATNSSQDSDGDIVFEVANHALDGALEDLFEDDADGEGDACIETLPNIERLDIELLCGHVAVPIDYDEPNRDTMSLPFVVLPSLSDNPSEEPLVFLQGGPGFSTMPEIALFVGSPEFRQDRDIIFLEQRGTDPYGVFLDCSDVAEPDGLQTCRDRHVASGVDLSSITTLNAAKDLATLRAHLGIERWHLLGSSYGTTLAMVAMDNDPDGVASVILDGPTAPDVIIYNADIESLLDTTARVLESCTADVDCSQRYPDLFDTHAANYQRLLEEPWNVENSGLGELVDVIDHELYLTVSYDVVVRQPGALPALVTAVANRDAETILAVVEAAQDVATAPGEKELEIGSRAMAVGQHLSIYCAEEAPFFDLETNPIDTADVWPVEIVDTVVELYVGRVESECGVWDVDPADPGDVDQITSTIPTLILAGEYDHTTPIRQGEIAAAGLSAAELIEVPSTGHTTIVNNCARSIMVDFLRAPGGDRSCLADIPSIEWQ